MSSFLPSLSDSTILPEKRQMTKPHWVMKLVTLHVVHALLVGAHVVALLAAKNGWSISVTLVQTGLTAGLQVASFIIIGGLVALAREIAVDADIRHPSTLGILHLRVKAWSGFSSSLSANWLYSRSPSTLTDSLTDSPRLKSILDASINMFAARTNDTRYPGLHGRLLHDTTNLDREASLEIPWSKARVNATLVNMHCSQISNAAINTFTLPRGSTDMKLAQPSPQNGQQRLLFQNETASFDLDAWINVSMPAPPYWNKDVPGLNIMGFWGSTESFGLPTAVYFQPWAFPQKSGPIGHHQLVMVIATGRYQSILLDSAQSAGRTLNLTMYPGVSGSGNGAQAYIQVVGCTVTNENLTATIDPQARLLDPPTAFRQLIGPEAPHDNHTWDEFATPAYNNTSTDPRTKFIGSPESILANLLDGKLSTPFGFTTSYSLPNSLVNFQGALERLYASYLWNVNRLCGPSSVNQIETYSETCSLGYSRFDLSSSLVQFEVLGPGFVLIVIMWRAIVSLVFCVLMWAMVWSLLHPAMGGGNEIQHYGLLDSARLLSSGSRIPEVVVAEAMALQRNKNSERGLLQALLRVVVTLVTSLLRLNSRKFVTLMATSETSSVW
ncbi:hypothetical protein B0H13DRAFT_2369302 [Mycena leptocephala]|nr:hypothetical protein B0H13DRAFT_2369302 [Mycena leptocephala]